MLNDEQRKIVEDNIKLVYKVASDRNQLCDEDAVQYGFYGLCKAVENFKPEKGIKFSTYAYNTIYGWMEGMYSDMKLRKSIKEGVIFFTDDVSIYQGEMEVNEDKLFLSYIYSSVDKCTKKILKMMYMGYRKGEIYKALGINSEIYNKKLKQIKEEFSYGRQQEC